MHIKAVANVSRGAEDKEFWKFFCIIEGYSNIIFSVKDKILLKNVKTADFLNSYFV